MRTNTLAVKALHRSMEPIVGDRLTVINNKDAVLACMYVCMYSM